MRNFKNHNPKILLLFIWILLYSPVHLKSFCHYDEKTDSYDAKNYPTLFDSYKVVEDWVDDDQNYNFGAIYQGKHKFYKTSPVITCLHIVISFPTKDSARVKILDAENQRWEVPEKYPFAFFERKRNLSKEESCCTMLLEKEPFALALIRKDTEEILFDTKDRKFVYSNLYIEISTRAPSKEIYGFGERTYKFKLDPGIYSMWGRDDADIIERGVGGGNLYGHQPVGLIRSEKKNFYIMLMRNSNAMDVVIDHSPGITFKSTGGVVDLIFFVGDTRPDTVIKTYHKFIGGFIIMPFWSLGYHQSKWGYNTQTELNGILEKFEAYKIPMDVIWSDVDYMLEKEDFTIDSKRFPPDEMKKMLKRFNKKWVAIIDAGIKISARNVKPVRSRGEAEGLKRDIFIKSGQGGNLVSKVWPGAVHFPDFFHPEAEQYWGEMLEDLYKQLPFAGIWLDMNEVATFANGELEIINGYFNENGRKRTHIYSDIPYSPGNRPLETKTISLDAVHYGNIKEYDVHELCNLLQTQATYNYLKTKSQLPFILTRANYVGIGKFAFHWSGDVGAFWSVMGYSIPGIFNFQIFGIPMTGADICGFFQNTTPELCIRWYQVGAFYPFARNHNHEASISQEPWSFLGQVLGNEVLGTAKAALETRYSILKWYYSLFIETKGFGTIFKPLFFEFPDEDILYEDYGPSEFQFLLGTSLMGTPKLEASGHKVKVYFPHDIWFDFFTGEKMIDEVQTDRFLTIFSEYNKSAPLFIRAGHIIHIQNVTNVLSTEDLNDEFELVIAFKSQNEKLVANGSILGIQNYNEEIISEKCIENNCFYNIQSEVKDLNNNDVRITIHFEAQDNSKTDLEDVGIFSLKIFGLPLNFMEEDDLKVANGFGVLLNGENQLVQNILLKEVKQLSHSAFYIGLLNPIRIKSKFTIIVKIII